MAKGPKVLKSWITDDEAIEVRLEEDEDGDLSVVAEDSQDELALATTPGQLDELMGILGKAKLALVKAENPSTGPDEEDSEEEDEDEEGDEDEEEETEEEEDA